MNEKEMICEVKEFTLSFPKHKVWYQAVCGINLQIEKGEMVGLVGESGCGKSVTALSLIGLQADNARLGGEITVEGRSVMELTEKEWARLRGNRISMIFQEPMTALNPLVKVGKQILEIVREHKAISKKEAKALVLQEMKLVGLPDVDMLYDCYPHQLSGGQRQRIMIAMAFINRPSLLIADEPTTALDVTIQAQILALMKKRNAQTGSAVLLISHDLGAVQSLCGRIAIMYAGHIVETGRTQDILEHPMHPYTKGLVAAIPSARKKKEELAAIPGSVPAIDKRPSVGCAFCGRCAWRKDICEKENPPYQVFEDKRGVLCHLPIEELTASFKKSDDTKQNQGV